MVGARQLTADNSNSASALNHSAAASAQPHAKAWISLTSKTAIKRCVGLEKSHQLAKSHITAIKLSSCIHPPTRDWREHSITAGGVQMFQEGWSMSEMGGAAAAESMNCLDLTDLLGGPIPSEVLPWQRTI